MRFLDLKQKEVINCKDCKRLGNVTDIEFDEHNGQLCGIIVPESLHFFGCFGMATYYYIRFCDIIRIGPDIILVDIDIAKTIHKCKD